MCRENDIGECSLLNRISKWDIHIKSLSRIQERMGWKIARGGNRSHLSATGKKCSHIYWTHSNYEYTHNTCPRSNHPKTKHETVKAHEAPSLAREFWKLMVSWEERDLPFFRSVYPKSLCTHSAGDTLTPMHT